MNRQQLEALKFDGYAPRTMLDIGAHVGSFTHNFLQAFPDCFPTLVEPNPFCEEALARTPYERHMVAASDENGEAELYLTKEWLQSTGVSLYRETTDYFRDEVLIRKTVPKARLDDLFAGRRFDFVKIDTQGSELDVLRGGGNVLRQADYILLEVSVVNFNEGGAQAELVFQQMAELGFAPADVTDFHRLRGVRDGGLLQIDVLFKRRAARPVQFGRLAGLHDLNGLVGHLYERRAREPGFRILLIGGGPPGWPDNLRDAVLGGPDADFPGDLSDPDTYRAILDHVAREGRFDYVVAPHVAQLLARPSTLLRHLPLLGEAGWLTAPSRFLELMKIEGPHRGYAHHGWVLDHDGGVLVLAPKSPLIEHLTYPGEAEWRQRPDRLELQIGWRGGLRFEILTGESGLLSHDETLARLGRFLEGAPPNRIPAEAHQASAIAADLAAAVAAARDPNSGLHPLGRLKFYHDAASLILCEPLTPERLALFEALLAEAEALEVEALKAHADALGARVVFFAAADFRYVELYARWLALSVLKFSDTPFLVVFHVIGGADKLAEAAATVRVEDPRIVFTGDHFDASAVTTLCYEAPPKGLMTIPVAHYQSVRFQRLGGLLDLLQRPVFVSDIDLLLQRGVADLLERWAEADLVLNENETNTQAGSRITANLLLARPTPAMATFLNWTRAYLDARLSGETVTRWIDQLALNLARRHFELHAPNARIGLFDTNSDINNVMFSQYVPGHPFRFLSLYHGFDTSTLEE